MQIPLYCLPLDAPLCFCRSRQQDPLPAQRPPSRPSSRQALLQQELQEQNFTRSRSLGGYYQGVAPPPQRNQQLRGVPNVPHHVGSMTPNSYSKWQHVHQHKPHNPLYDTPPTQRAIMRPQGLQMGEIRGVMGNASGSPLMNHLRVQGPQRSMLTEPVLSPILTDTEISPLHRTGMGSAPGKISKIKRHSGNTLHHNKEITKYLISQFVHFSLQSFDFGKFKLLLLLQIT